MNTCIYCRGVISVVERRQSLPVHLTDEKKILSQNKILKY